MLGVMSDLGCDSYNSRLLKEGAVPDDWKVRNKIGETYETDEK